ncbi:MAG: crossover junction endodeoxyribonuclease RuvC [Patescibacteria group bacterium]|nr:crossover junction endodeoxyribonuclease RuvC [Patescibacteria group bacterium]MBU1876810.1 crossover junction endodeoxyribonuclease RuvC [Patescibacteria group bacterium]
MIILGIDPGTATTGYGIIQDKKTKGKNRTFKCICCGTIQTKPTQSIPYRLQIIQKELAKIINQYNPEILVMERIFFFRNVKTIITVSQAQGIILFTAAKKKLPVYQFTPLQVKMTITGYGRAEKKEVEKKVKKIFKTKTLPSKSDDAIDALAIALTYHLKTDNKTIKALDKLS